MIDIFIILAGDMLHSAQRRDVLWHTQFWQQENGMITIIYLIELQGPPGQNRIGLWDITISMYGEFFGPCITINHNGDGEPFLPFFWILATYDLLYKVLDSANK